MTTAQGLKTIDIKGKDYVEVHERVRFFRETFPDYSLETSWIDINNEIAICQAIIKNPDARIVSSGTAFERSGSTFINKTSHIENAETSAVGRALGFLNIGINTSIASADEVATAIKNQKNAKSKNVPVCGGKASKIKNIPVKPATKQPNKTFAMWLAEDQGLSSEDLNVLTDILVSRGMLPKGKFLNDLPSAIKHEIAGNMITWSKLIGEYKNNKPKDEIPY